MIPTVRSDHNGRPSQLNAQQAGRHPGARTNDYGIEETTVTAHNDPGMLSDPQYAARWQTKRGAYLAACVRPIEENAGGDVLIETRELTGQGLDMGQVERLAKLILG